MPSIPKNSKSPFCAKPFRLPIVRSPILPGGLAEGARAPGLQAVLLLCYAADASLEHSHAAGRTPPRSRQDPTD
ncbi:hypothetical protein GUJ93_ZPchr0012g21519 [Zizania palustris]|uniref:Uncharacterized protein n=1 Tax=Zizania palustris TaxID=103762 RepID=A0A8J6BWX0_ZIZPA|nr:hypothetical protein GUJ93_ZPchr0012g21519 [Zizania palustris]